GLGLGLVGVRRGARGGEPLRVRRLARRRVPRVQPHQLPGDDPRRPAGGVADGLRLPRRARDVLEGIGGKESGDRSQESEWTWGRYRLLTPVSCLLTPDS